MSVLKYAVGIIGLIACLWVLATGPGSEATELEKEAYAKTPQMGMAIYYTIIVIVAAVAGVLLFFLYQLISNAKKTLLSIAGIVAAFVVYLIFRLVGTSDTNETLQMDVDKYVSDATLDATTAGLWTVMIGIIVATILAIFGPFILGKYRK